MNMFFSFIALYMGLNYGIIAISLFIGARIGHPIGAELSAMYSEMGVLKQLAFTLTLGLLFLPVLLLGMFVDILRF